MYLVTTSTGIISQEPLRIKDMVDYDKSDQIYCSLIAAENRKILEYCSAKALFIRERVLIELKKINTIYSFYSFVRYNLKFIRQIMLGRPQFRMEQSYKEIHENLPSFQQEESASYSRKSTKQKEAVNAYQNMPYTQQQVKYTAYRSEFSEESRPNASRNDILKELRQEYEILRNISIEESEHIPLKQVQQKNPKYQEGSSDLSSSVASKQSKNKDSRPVKQSTREVQQLHLEKKQLQLVIGNSMRKIEELLNNEITLKKTIHELKTQIDGKGGISMEYEKTIRNLQKNEEELQSEVARLRHENEKHTQKIRDSTERIRSLEGELEAKQRQIKQGFQEQRRFHELIRIEKDKYLNLEVECRSLKMELQMVEKDKNNEISRLMKQLQVREGSSDKEMGYLIKKLQSEIKEKDRRFHELLMERQRRVERESEVISLEKKGDKNFLEEILERSKSMNESSNRAITDGMNMIFAKMKELEKRNDETLKKQIEEIKRRVENDSRRKGSTQVVVDREREKELLSRVVELQRIIQKEVTQKSKLASEIKVIQDHKIELEEQNRIFERKVKELEIKQSTLIEEIGELQTLRANYQAIVNERNALQGENSLFIEKLKAYERDQENQRNSIDGHFTGFREKEKKYEQEIRILKRKVDEAIFEAEKNKKEGDFNINMYKTTQESELRRLTTENARLSQKLRQTEERLVKVEREFQTTVKGKDKELTEHRAALESVRAKTQEDLISQKKFYQERISQVETRHSGELKSFNEKFIALSSTNEKLIGQLAHMGMLESEVLELRRLLRSCRSLNAGIDHLWEVKEAEYENISQIIKGLYAQ